MNFTSGALPSDRVRQGLDIICVRLGKDRVGVFVGDKDKAAIKQFVNSCVLTLLERKHMP